MSLWDRVRRNHALEHGTITLLLQRASLHRVVAGNAMPGGFFVYGDVPTETLSACATDAMERMRQGERDLAVSPFCGTNIVVAAALATVGTLAALRFLRPRAKRMGPGVLQRYLGAGAGPATRRGHPASLHDPGGGGRDGGQGRFPVAVGPSGRPLGVYVAGGIASYPSPPCSPPPRERA